MSICLLVSAVLLPVSAYASLSVKVEVEGLEGELEKNALAYLDIVKHKDDEQLSVRWLKKLHQQAPENIRTALQPFGYYRPEITSSLTETDGLWLARYTVAPGEPVRIVSKDIVWQGEGAEKKAFRDSIARFGKLLGDTLNDERYEKVKVDLLNLALGQGYPKATIVKSEVLVDIEKNTARITLHLDTGALYYFGKVRFEQDFLDPDLLADYVTLTPGEPYSHEALIAFQQNLLASNFAREVTLNARFEEAEEQRVPITVVMKPIKPHKISVGIGYETNVGPRGSFRWTDRLINRYGHHSDVYVKYSEKERLAQVQYAVPVFVPVTDQWVTSASYQYEETPTTTSDTMDIETAFVRQNLTDTLLLKGYVLRSLERFTVGNEPKTTTNLLTFGGITRFSEIEDDLFPQNGHYLYLDLRGAAEQVFSDTSFTRFEAQGRYLFGIGESIRIDTRVDFGWSTVGDFSLYPASLRYFAGGDNSVRGYKYQSLGPTDDTGTVIGGKHLFTGSVEYDQRVAESWVLATFVDAGNAYNNELEVMYVGAGFGVRWLAPFGSLRVDLAWPVSEQPGLTDVRLHVGFGATL